MYGFPDRHLNRSCRTEDDFSCKNNTPRGTLRQRYTDREIGVKVQRSARARPSHRVAIVTLAFPRPSEISKKIRGKYVALEGFAKSQNVIPILREEKKLSTGPGRGLLDQEEFYCRWRPEQGHKPWQTLRTWTLKGLRRLFKLKKVFSQDKSTHSKPDQLHSRKHQKSHKTSWTWRSATSS